MPPADAPGFCKEICRFQRPKSGAVNAKTKSMLAFTLSESVILADKFSGSVISQRNVDDKGSAVKYMGKVSDK